MISAQISPNQSLKHEIFKEIQQDANLKLVSQNIHLRTVYQRIKKVTKSLALKNSNEIQELKNSSTHLNNLITDGHKKPLAQYSAIQQNIKPYKNISIISSQKLHQNDNIIIQKVSNQPSSTLSLGQSNFVTNNFRHRKINKSIEANQFQPPVLQTPLSKKDNKKALPNSASPNKRKLRQLQLHKYSDDVYEDKLENYYLPSVESSSKKTLNIKNSRSISRLKRMKINQEQQIHTPTKERQMDKEVLIQTTQTNKQNTYSTSPTSTAVSSFTDPTPKITNNQNIQISIAETPKSIQTNNPITILSSEDSNFNIESEFNDEIIRQQLNQNNLSNNNNNNNKPSNETRINTEEFENRRLRRDGFLSYRGKECVKIRSDKQIQQSIDISQCSEDTSKPKQQEKVPQFLIEDQQQIYEEDLNKRFLEEFIQVNKLFMQDNLELSVQIDRECVQLFRKKSSSADVMMSINLPEKTENTINQYVDILRKGQNEQISQKVGEEKGKEYKLTKKYITKDYTWSPYDLVIIIDNNVSNEYLINIKRALQFVFTHSTQNDRICLVFPSQNSITKSKLVRCDLYNKEYLNEILAYIEPDCMTPSIESSFSSIASTELLDLALSVISTRKDTNFITQIYYFTEGQSSIIAQQMKNQLETYSTQQKKTLLFSIFQMQNTHHDSSLLQITQLKQGDFHYIEDPSTLPIIAAKALGQLKTTVGFKGSAMIMPVLDKGFLQQIVMERKYGGQSIWKSDTDLQAQSIDMHTFVAGCSKNFNLKYSFPATKYFIGDEWIQKPTFKAACLIFFESQKYQQYIYSEQIKKITFENGDQYKTEYESIQSNPYNLGVLRNSFKYEIIDTLDSFVSSLEKNNRDYSLLKFQENLETIQSEYFLEISMHFEEMLDEIDILKKETSQSYDFNKINKNILNKLHSFLDAHKYQKSQICKSQISFMNQVSDYYMNYAQFYFQRLSQQQQNK